MEISKPNSINDNEKEHVVSIGLINTKTLETRFFKDPMFLKEMLSNYIATSSQCLGEMNSAEKNQNYLIFANSCHKLLGSTLNFSNGYITRSLENMELATRSQQKITVSAYDLEKLSEAISMLVKEITQLADSWSDL